MPSSARAMPNPGPLLPMPPTPGAGIGWRQPHYTQVLERLPRLGFLEVHSENFFAQGGAALAVLERGRAHYPISLHGVGLSLGSAVGLDAWHLDQLARLVERIDPLHVSDHASFARGHWPGAPDGPPLHAADLLPLPFSDEALDTLCAHVHQVQDRLQRRFLVENICAYVRWLPQPGEALMSEPAFLTTLARRTGCALLVDVNNLYVNALNARIHGAAGDPVQHVWIGLMPYRPSTWPKFTWRATALCSRSVVMTGKARSWWMTTAAESARKSGRFTATPLAGLERFRR